MRASITKGDRNLTDEAKGLKTPTVYDDNTSSSNTTSKSSSNNASIDFIVVNAYNSAARQQIPVTRAASIITGRIRVKFTEGIKSLSENAVNGFDISSLKYLDEVLFDNMQYIVASVMHYGSKGSAITLSQCMKMIRDTANLIDYKLNQNSYEEIEKILKVVYNE